MKFNPAPDDDNNMIYQRLLSEDGKIEIGIHPVMFGYRVRAGYVGDMYVHLDWCGGDDHSSIEVLYSMAKNILEAKGDFKGLPGCSTIKPYYKDVEFMTEIMKHTTEPLEVIKLPSLWQFRQRMMEQVIKYNE